MRKDKDYIFGLRKLGKSYREIQQLTSISRGTLTAWFKDETWSKHLSKENAINRSVDTGTLVAARKRALQARYQNATKEALAEYTSFRHEPLFWAGLMVYGAAGDKRSPGLLRVTSGEFYLHKMFLLFAERYLNVSHENIRLGLILSPGINESLCTALWSNLLGIPRNHFYKAQRLNADRRGKPLQYGVGMSIISSTLRKRKLTTWLALAEDERFSD